MSSISFYNSESINMLLSSGLTTRKSNSILAVRVTHFQGLIYPHCHQSGMALITSC